MPRRNDWQSRFGASRRAKDKAYCQAAERAIVVDVAPQQNAWTKVDVDRAAIARAFGRPLS